MESKTGNQRGSCLRGCLKFIGGLAGAVIISIICTILGYLTLRAAGAYLIIADDLVQADAIVIMGGGGEGRMNEALEIYSEKYSRIIILTETGERVEEFDYLQSFDLRIQLLSNGVPEGNILITDSKVTSTLEEAHAVKQLMERRQFGSAIVVTDPFHTKRTSIIFRDVFSDSGINLKFRPVTPSWYTSKTWFLKPEGWRYTVLEYVKLIAYKLGLRNGQEI
jgi:uncharacterized SAM-binding protein YcdF (DUF218 family)